MRFALCASRLKRAACHGAATLALVSLGTAQAAQIDRTDFAQLERQAQRQTMVPVLVDVELVSLDALQGTRHKATIERRTAALVGELGSTAEPGGPHWSNGIGQIELYVSAAGLKILKNSSNAIAFRAGKAWWQRTHLVDSAGHFKAMDAALTRQGFVDVQVLPKVEGMEFGLQADGGVQLSTTSLQQARLHAEGIERGLGARHVLSSPGTFAISQAGPPAVEGAMVKRLTRAGLAKLAQSDDVRNLLPLNLSDPRPLEVDADALKRAAADGTVDVIVNLRMPLFAAGLSKASMKAQERSHRAALDDVLAVAGVNGQWGCQKFCV